MNQSGAGRDLASQDRLTGANEARRLTPVAGADGTPRSHAEVMADETLDEKSEGSRPREENDTGSQAPQTQ